MSSEEADSQDALHRRKMRRVEKPVEEPVEKGGSPSSSSSDAHNELQSVSQDDTNGHDDHTNEHDDQSDCEDQSAATMLKRQPTDYVSGNSTVVTGAPELQKADLIPALVETTEASSPAPIEVSAISGGSRPFHINQDIHLNPQDQLQVPVQSIWSPEHSVLPPAMRMHSQLPISNFPVDQPARNGSFYGTGLVNMQNSVNNAYINLSTPNLPLELHLPSSVRFPGSQLNPSYSEVSSQVANGIGTRAQWVNSGPQKQINLFEPSMPLRQQDIQVQRLLPHLSLPPNDSIYQFGESPYLQLPGNPTQLGMGAYNMGPSLPLHMEELPVMGDFNSGLGLGGQGPFLYGSHIGMEESSSGQPSRFPLVNTTWSDIVHPTRAPQLPDSVPQVQGAQCQVPTNRTLFNSVYDPTYEAMGLPIDPHLRMFLASKRERDSGEK